MLFKFREKKSWSGNWLPNVCVCVCLCRFFSVCQQRRLRKKSGFFMTFENILDRGGSHLPVFKQIYYLWTAPITKFWLNQVRSVAQSKNACFSKAKGWAWLSTVTTWMDDLDFCRVKLNADYTSLGETIRKPKYFMCTHLHNDHISMLKVLESTSEFDGLWNHPNNLACTKMGRNSVVGRASDWKTRHNTDTGSSPRLHTK